jgi:inorganic pyrophosphatase
MKQTKHTSINYKLFNFEKIEVMIEIPEGQGDIKYEIDIQDQQTVIRVDRFCGTTLKFPCNYGFIPRTRAGDNDPLDVLVITPVPLLISSLIHIRPIGVLMMTDEAGEDEKIIAVPDYKLTSLYDHVSSVHDLPPLLLERITHFFEHYKDLEKGKWVKLSGIQDVDSAYDIIHRSYMNFRSE